MKTPTPTTTAAPDVQAFHGSSLELRNLTMAYGGIEVLRNVSLTVRKGERHALIGPNGAGKTSLVHQIAGQLAPTSGRILLNDRDLVGETPEARCQLGIGRTFQKNNLFRALSVRENVRAGGRNRHAAL